MRRLLLFLLLALTYHTPAFPQAREEEKPIAPEDYVRHHSYINGGFGTGYDYGGHLGTKINFLPVQWFNVFGSVGLWYYSTGFATGVQLRLPTERRIEPYITGMYGVNAGLESEVFITRKQYYGYSVGGGIEVKSKNSEKTFWTIGFLVPFRDPQFQRDVDALRGQGLVVNSSNWPVTLTLGVHFRLDLK